MLFCAAIQEWVSRWISVRIPGLNDTEKVRLPEKFVFGVG